MLRYFLDDREVTESDAATAWFNRAENRGIDVPKAISIWEDASEAIGEDSKRIVEQSGIRVENCKK